MNQYEDHWEEMDIDMEPRAEQEPSLVPSSHRNLKEEEEEEQQHLGRLERERRIFTAVNLTFKWKRLSDEGGRHFANREFSSAYFDFHDAIRTLESIDVEWLGFVETLLKAGQSSLKMAMRVIHRDYDGEWEDYDQEYYGELRGEQFAQFKEAEDCFKRALKMLERMDRFEDDYHRKMELRSDVLLALQQVLRIRKDHGFLCSTEEISAKEIELAKVTEELQFYSRRREPQKLEPLEETFFSALSSLDHAVNGSYEFVGLINRTGTILEQLSEQIRSVYGNESLQTANAVEMLASKTAYSEDGKRLELLRESLRTRIKLTGVKNASVISLIRRLAWIHYPEQLVLHDALIDYAKEFEKLLETNVRRRDYDEADPERYDWQTKRNIEKYLANTGRQQQETTFDEAATAVKKWLEEQAICYLNELMMERSRKRVKRLSEDQRYKKLIALINQSLAIARIVDEEERHPQNTIALLSLLSEAHKRVGDTEQAQRYYDEKLGIVVRKCGSDHAMLKEALK